MTPRIVFFGTPFFAAEILEHLIQHQVPIEAVVTQPDRPKGRSLQLAPSPVKTIAEKMGIPILQPEKCSDPTFLTQIAQIPAQLYVVVAFGQILPQKLLDIPPLGCINVHASLLPKYRGAAPIHRCLLNGDKETGVCIQKMVKQLDAGDVIDESRLSIPPEMTFGELEVALCNLSKPLLLSILKAYTRGVPPALPQDSNLVTYAAKVEPEEGKIDWSQSATQLHNLIRAFNPRPGAWCQIRQNGEQKRLKIFRTHVEQATGTPGQILPTKDFIVACGSGALRIQEVQPEGKARMNGSDWLRGQKSVPIFF
jgi:methionyl-tRNA formyltransferase